jgi:hypothetical protein
MAKIYCGNNSLHTGLLNGQEILGTRYQCLRKGIGVGSHLPYDPNNLNQFQRLDPRKPYCGNSAVLPGGYNHMGSLKECYTAGVGIGMTQRAQQGYIFIKSPLFYNIIFLSIFIGTCALCYFYKPAIIVKEKDGNNIDWEKFSANMIVLALILIIIRFFTVVKTN